VKSVTGYDIPKLMVGALGTLGVLAELTLRLHPRPETEGTWIATFPSAGAAQAFVGLVLDSSLQPNRLEFLNGPALRACAGTAAPAAVAVSIGSVEAAVREQGRRLVALTEQARGRAAPAPPDFWARFDHASARANGQVVLQVGTLASRLAETVEAIEQGTPAAAGGGATLVTGCAALGALRVILGAGTEEAATLIERLREAASDFGGSVIVLAGPRALRAKVDPWGPVEPGALALMRALKDEFDPRRVLNPGRFVGGL
jgi:glycolate oxidase FAD binding subunit